MLPVLLVVLCTVLRIVPHPPNFAPVGATAVLAGRTMKPWMALVWVAIAMFVGDVTLAHLHGYPVVSFVTPFVYGGFFVQTLLGRWLRSKQGGAMGAALLGSAAFFVLSNLGVWMTSGMYARTASGLAACYAAAAPFFGGTVLGDVAWTVVLSAAYRPVATRLERLRYWVPIPSHQLSVV